MDIINLPYNVFEKIFINYVDPKISRLISKDICKKCDAILVKKNHLFAIAKSCKEENLKSRVNKKFTSQEKTTTFTRALVKTKSSIFDRPTHFDITFEEDFGVPQDEDAEKFFGAMFFPKNYRKLPILNISPFKAKIDPKFATSQITAPIMRGTNSEGEHFFTVRIESPVKGKTYAIFERHSCQAIISRFNEDKKCLVYYWTITELKDVIVPDDSTKSIFHTTNSKPRTYGRHTCLGTYSETKKTNDKLIDLSYQIIHKEKNLHEKIW